MKKLKKQNKQINKVRLFKRIDFKERVIMENRYTVDLKSLKDIAKELGRPICTIQREIKEKPRIGRGKYQAHIAQNRYLENKKKQGRKSKLMNLELKEYVINKLKLGWSPEQISLRLAIDYVKDKKMRISYEAIYNYVYSQSGKEDLHKYLPRRHIPIPKQNVTFL